MWLSIIAVAMLIFGIVGSILSGGIFTIVLIPLGAIALLSAAVHGALARKTQANTGSDGNTSSRRTVDPLPTSTRQNVAPAPSTPADLVDARRQQQ
jgi:hypothetical protein